MPGVFTHTAVALLSLLIVHMLHFKWEYSLSIFVGNFVPDAIKFGLTAIKQGTLAIFRVEQDSFYHFLDGYTSEMTFWFTLGFFFLGTAALLYHYHVIKKKKMEEYDELYVFFLIGIVTHLILDALIIENGPWV